MPGCVFKCCTIRMVVLLYAMTSPAAVSPRRYPLIAAANSSAIEEPFGMTDSDMGRTYCLPIILVLGALYFVVFVAKMFVETMNELGFTERERELKCMARAKDSVFLVPMLSVLLLFTHLRALGPAGSHTGGVHVPQAWLIGAIVVCAAAVLTQCAVTVGGSLAWSETWESVARGEAPAPARAACIVIKGMATGTMYLSITAVCVGAFAMAVPPELGEQVKPLETPSPYLRYVKYVGGLFFAIHVCSALVKFTTNAGLCGQRRRFVFLQELLRKLASVVSPSSMICLLFLATDMRLKLLVGVSVPTLSDACRLGAIGMYLLALHAAASCTMEALYPRDPGSLGVSPRSKPEANGLVASTVEAVEPVATLAIFISVAFILYIMLSAETAPAVKQDQPNNPILLATASMMYLGALYFGVYFAAGLTDRVKRCRQDAPFPRAGKRASTLSQTLSEFLATRAQEAVQLCPMVSILLICTVWQPFLRSMADAEQTLTLSSRLVVMTLCSMTVLTFSRLDELSCTEPGLAVSVSCGIMQYISLAVLFVSTTGNLIEGVIA